mmetsp:Transcript_5323/g.18645  ORF Transcript_5323/g.18645 Transcript_5323/m.18645 type:complete len:266 (+) Transcript_5323:536-1333(+)
MVELTPAAALAAAPRGRRLLLLVGRGLGLLLERADVALLQLAALGAPVVAPLQPLLLLLRRRRRWRRRWLADLFSRVGPHAKRGLEGGEGRQPVLHVAAPVAARGARPALIQVQLPPRALHARVVHLALVLALVVFRRRRAGSAPVALLLVLAHELGRPRGKHAAVVVVVVVVYDVVLVALVVVRGRLAAAGPEVPGPPPGDGGIVETTGHGLVVRALPAADLAEAWLEFPHAAPRKKKKKRTREALFFSLARCLVSRSSARPRP